VKGVACKGKAKYCSVSPDKKVDARDLKVLSYMRVPTGGRWGGGTKEETAASTKKSVVKGSMVPKKRGEGIVR